MRTRAASVTLVVLALGCGPSGRSETGDTAALPDTSAVQGAGTVPHPPPAAAESAAARDSAARRKSP